MSKKNSINNSSETLTIDPGTSGDSATQFSINTTSKFKVGVDDDAADAFKISAGDTLGSSDCLIIQSTGQINKPLQPAFLVTVDSDITNVTGDNTVYSVVFDNTEFDVGSNFSSTTFTAPVAGKYYFSAGVQVGSVTASYTLIKLGIVTTSNSYQFDLLDPGSIQSSGYLGLTGSVIANMAASDTAYMTVRVGNSAKVIDITGNTTAGAVVNWFGGYLLG